MQSWNAGKDTHLSVSRTVASLCVQSKQLLRQLHLQVSLHGAVVVTWAAGLQGGGHENDGWWRDE